MKNNQHNHTRTFMYLIQVQAFFMSLFQLLANVGLWLHPFQNRTLQLRSATQLILPYMKIQAESIWQCTERHVG